MTVRFMVRARIGDFMGYCPNGRAWIPQKTARRHRPWQAQVRIFGRHFIVEWGL